MSVDNGASDIKKISIVAEGKFGEPSRKSVAPRTDDGQTTVACGRA